MTEAALLDTNRMIAMYGSPDLWCGVSASNAGAMLGCPARLALPAAYTTTEAADRGNELHEFARIITVNPNGREQALLAVTEKYRKTAEGMNLGEALEGLRIVGCERAYALDVKERTVRYIGENVHRMYNQTLQLRGEPPLRRYEIPFTMDVEAMLDDGTPVELDYKSGQSVGPVDEHWQRRICASGLMLAYDTSTAVGRVGYIWQDGRIVVEGHEFGAIDVDDFCDQLVAGIDKVWHARLLFANAIMPAISPSDSNCAFCPAVSGCPYWTNYAKAMIGRLEEITNGPECSSLTDEEKGRLWDECKKYELMIKNTITALKLMADQAPIPINDKFEVRPQERSKEYFDQSKARGLIMQLLGRDGSVVAKSDEEIKKTIKGLTGTTEYVEYRKVKRQLPMVA